MFLGYDLSYKADPAQHIITAGEELDDLQIDHDLSGVWSISRVVFRGSEP